MTRLSLFLLALGACTEARGPLPAAASIDPTQAQAAVSAFLQAVERGDQEALARTFSLGDLVRSTRPADLPPVDARTEAKVARLLTEQILDPGGRVRRMLTGVTLGEARATGETTIVWGSTPETRLRFHVARRGDQIQVVRLD
jgi:hypothetical protein